MKTEIKNQIKNRKTEIKKIEKLLAQFSGSKFGASLDNETQEKYDALHLEIGMLKEYGYIW